MKKWIKGFLIGFGALIFILLILFAFVYFSFDDRIEIETSVSPFKNEHPIIRLDSSTLPPDSLTYFVTALMAKVNVHGIGISVINNNNLVYQQYFGYKNKQKGETFVPGTIFYGASFSKTIFADVVLQLIAENVIQLDTPLYKYLHKPLYAHKTNFIQRLFGANFIDYSELEGDNRYKEFTARMCLSHTTGLPNWRWIEDDQKLKIKFDPGARYSYSGEGMFLLQVVLEEMTGKDFEEVALEKVLGPLGMSRSSYVWQRTYEDNYCVGHDTPGNDLGIPKRNLPNAAGSLSTTLEDYTLFFQSVLRQKENRYKQLITPQIIIKSKQQFGPNALIDVNDNDSIQLSYGLGFGLYETPYGRAFFKEGHLEGWQHYAVGFLTRGTALIMMSNSDNAESIFKELIEYTLGNRYTPWFWEGYIPYDLDSHTKN
jgi:D-alanyl-D-alanine-carboxypeptidase/D-alanyl-D-alanine-endopeptidase